MTGRGSSDRLIEFDHGCVSFVGGCALVEAAVGPVFVVMRYELFEEPTQLTLVPDQGPVE